MSFHSFEDLSPEDQECIEAFLEGSLSNEAFESLQDRMMTDPALRVVMRRVLTLDDTLRTGSLQAAADQAFVPSPRTSSRLSPPESSTRRRIQWLIPLALAACLVAILSFQFSAPKPESDLVESQSQTLDQGIPKANGFAVLRQLLEPEWPEPAASRQEGVILGAETFQLSSGTAEIQFFSGATIILEGPARLTLKSAWEGTLTQGRIRVQVPPAARGFTLQTPEAKIVDLGTEYGLEIGSDRNHLEVFQGEIEWHPELGSVARLIEGEAIQISKGGGMQPLAPGFGTFPDSSRLDPSATQQLQADFLRWTLHRDALVQNPDLILFYTFEQLESGETIPNRVLPRNPELDGAMVLAESVDGRWPGLKPALEFRRPGARVRVHVPGEFSAFTFSCWVRIDSLDRRYNALFMGDGYETGEPHWQIRDDGRLMLSIMVDDSRPSVYRNDAAGFHRVYFSPPMWDISMSGQWLHIASVFDPARKQVNHYLNGSILSEEAIPTEYQIETLRIGNAEVGNWGQPFRKDPSFAIRNLNGRMDELHIFKRALSPKKIATLFENSRSLRR